jgi:hypothetical protein
MCCGAMGRLGVLKGYSKTLLNPYRVDEKIGTVTQGGASRLTPLRLPWAMALDAFSVSGKDAGYPTFRTAGQASSGTVGRNASLLIAWPETKFR